MSRRTIAMLSVLSLGCGFAQAQTFSIFGTGCKGGQGVPALVGFGDHKVGGSTTLQVTNLEPKQPGVLYWGVSDSVWLNNLRLPYDLGALGMTGCTQYVSTDGMVPAPSGTGFVNIEFKLPATRSLIGKTLYSQYAMLDPTVSAPLKVVTSNAGKLSVGPACKDGNKFQARSSFKVTIPPIPQFGTPPITVTGNYSGETQQRCCVGPLNSKSGCMFTGTGTANGALGAFSVPVPPDLQKKFSDDLCATVRSKTGGLVNCTLSFPTINATSARLTGNINATRNGCNGAYTWGGNGGLAFGKVTARVKANLTITIIFKIRFSTTIDVEGNPTGSWRIANNKITASAALAEIRASKTFKILGIPITFRQTFKTPTIKGTTSAVAMPAPPITCS